VFFSKVSTQSFRGSDATSEPKVGWTLPTSSAAFFCAVVVPNHFQVHFLASVGGREAGAAGQMRARGRATGCGA
jgi:hypothetical protein